jgi:hypothetical protein
MRRALASLFAVRPNCPYRIDAVYGNYRLNAANLGRRVLIRIGE